MHQRTAVRLKGITWDHSRGFTPMVATAQRFHELHPEVEIIWTKRSLQQFADEAVDDLVTQFDLLVIDHPWIGTAAARTMFRPFLQQEVEDVPCVGCSAASYAWEGQRWALPIDAAAPVCAYRPDLMAQWGELPTSWDHLLSLAQRGAVACPSISLDVYGNFLNLCTALGGEVFPDPEQVAEPEIGCTALEMLREFTGMLDRQFLQLNPIRTLELMSQSDCFAYCPFTYGYSNYGRVGYAPHILRFGDVVQVSVACRTMLGGTGLAVSAASVYGEVAAAYAAFVASTPIQGGLYFEAGGQPAAREAWQSPRLNTVTSNFFEDTRAVLERAFVRPRYAGYLPFQDAAGPLVHAFVQEEGSARDLLSRLNLLYRESQEVS